MGASSINIRKKWKFFVTKSAQQAANGSVWMPQALKPPCLIHFWVNPFFSFSTLWVNEKWEPPVWRSERWIFKKKNKLNKLQMVQFEFPRYWNPCISTIFWWLPFSHFQPSGVIRNGSPKYIGQEDEKMLWQNQLNKLQLVHFECPRHWSPCV